MGKKCLLILVILFVVFVSCIYSTDVSTGYYQLNKKLVPIDYIYQNITIGKYIYNLLNNIPGNAGTYDKMSPHMVSTLSGVYIVCLGSVANKENCDAMIANWKIQFSYYKHIPKLSGYYVNDKIVCVVFRVPNYDKKHFWGDFRIEY